MYEQSFCELSDILIMTAISYMYIQSIPVYCLKTHHMIDAGPINQGFPFRSQ